MYLIVGLGNPEEQYHNTRHNMGFDVINSLAKEYEIDISRTKFNGLYGTGIIENKKVILLKPQTFMNLSGESVIEFKNFYKLANQELIVIYDDIDLEPGSIRIRREGSPGTHNGAKSVTHSLGTDGFARIRVGIGSPDEFTDLVDHVIKQITDEERKILEKGIEKAKDGVTQILKSDIQSAMNKYN